MPPVKKALSPQELWDASPSIEELPDNSDDLSGEEPPKSAAQRLWELAGDATDVAASSTLHGIENAARSVSDTVTEGVPNTLNFLSDAAKRAPEVQSRMGIPKESQFNAQPGTPAWAGQQAVEAVLGAGDVLHDKLSALPENERNAVLTRVGGTVLGVLAGGPTAGILKQAVMSSLGGALGGEVSQEMGFEADTPLFSKEQLKKEGAQFVENILFPGLLKGAGKVLSSTGKLTQDASVPIGAKAMAEKGTPAYLSGRFTKGKNVGSEMIAVKEMAEGEKTLAKVIADEFPDKIQHAGEFGKHLEDAIATRRTEKAGVMSELVQSLQNAPGVKPFSRRDSGYAELTREIRRLKKSGVGDELAKDLEGLQKKLSEAFSQPMAQGQPGTRMRYKGFEAMDDVLGEVYGKLRGLGSFDDTALAAAGKDPSRVKREIVAYKKVAGALKDSMRKKALELERGGHLGAGTAKRLDELNSEIHDLIPFKDAADRFWYSEYQLRKKDQPAGTLLTDPTSPGSGGGTMLSRARDIITSPATKYMIERSRLNQSLGFAPDTFQDMRDASQMLLGRQPIPSTAPRGLSGSVIGPAEEAAGNALQATVASGAIPVAQAAQQPAISTLASDPTAMTTSALTTIVNDPLSLQMIENDPDIKPETVSMLRQALNGTAYEQQKALGQLKIEARDKGWFPPSPMQGIHSFIAVPKATYKGEKVLGTITDQAEGMIFLDAVNEVPDVTKRAKLKSAFNSPGHYVLEFPDTLRVEVKKAAAPIPVESEVDLETGSESSVAESSLDEGSGAMDRVLHEY